ncbi:hypothetical protein NDU88_003833 [Pleurodeles waltl]|uniref:Uncharacterized protein n=1 Tax=Pleurodeles waltl TaxID=8319 RepID=A0AAV7WQ73_PLEWA|nr:hypothetical protein NDU88_003833 [Pleurodeles waltl]
MCLACKPPEDCLHKSIYVRSPQPPSGGWRRPARPVLLVAVRGPEACYWRSLALRRCPAPPAHSRSQCGSEERRGVLLVPEESGQWGRDKRIFSGCTVFLGNAKDYAYFCLPCSRSVGTDFRRLLQQHTDRRPVSQGSGPGVQRLSGRNAPVFYLRVQTDAPYRQPGGSEQLRSHQRL